MEINNTFCFCRLFFSAFQTSINYTFMYRSTLQRNFSGGSHLQMSVISVGTGSSLVSLGIIAKPPTAYRKPPIEIRLRELRS